MDEARLAEIERQHAEHCGDCCCQGFGRSGCTRDDCPTFLLLAEVWRLRERNAELYRDLRHMNRRVLADASGSC